jgi:hypothetical protein
MTHGLNKFDFRMDPDSGQLVAVKQQMVEPEPLAQPRAVEPVPVVPSATPKPAPATDPRDVRIAQLEEQVNTLIGQNNQTPNPTPQQQTIELPEDGNLTPADYNFLVDVLKEIVIKAVEPMEPVIQDYAVQRQVQDIVTELEVQHPGAGMNKWSAVLPEIRKVVENAPELSITQAYAVVKGHQTDAIPPAATPAPEAQSNSGEADDTPVDTQAKLAEARAKAAKLQTEEGVGGEATPAGSDEILTVRDALNAAVDQVYNK